MQAARTVPSGLKLTAWLWIASGILMAFSGAMAALVYVLMGQLPPPNDGMPGGVRALITLFRHFDALIVLQLAVAFLAIWSGMALLQLKGWARTVLESLSWLGLAYLLGFCIFWIETWLALAGGQAAAADGARAYHLMGIGMAVVVTLAFALPLAIMVRYLRSAEARAATAPLEPPPGATAPPGGDDGP